MKTTKNILLKGSNGKPVSADIFFDETIIPKPVIIYAHGFNGFKDWGNFDLIAERFAAAGFTFIKFNFSHNGTTPEAPEEFTDLAAYAMNNYSRELEDLGAVIDWVSLVNPFAPVIDAGRIGLLGHSLGGGIVLIKAAEDTRVKAVCTWASVAECKTPWGSWPKARIDEWKQNGVAYITNRRTKQDLPLLYQLYEDYQQNSKRLNICDAVEALEIPQLICHGFQDTAVPVDKAHLLMSKNASAQLFLIDGDHVFGRAHPWLGNNLPEAMEKVVDRSLQFYKAALLL